MDVAHLGEAVEHDRDERAGRDQQGDCERAPHRASTIKAAADGNRASAETAVHVGDDRDDAGGEQRALRDPGAQADGDRSCHRRTTAVARVVAFPRMSDAVTTTRYAPGATWSVPSR